MRKAVAIPYIIALILGVAVIALLGIWFVTSGGKFTKESIDTQCRTKAIEFCARYTTSSDRTATTWSNVKGSLSCDLQGLGIGISTSTFPDCSKVLA